MIVFNEHELDTKVIVADIYCSCNYSWRIWLYIGTIHVEHVHEATH